MYSSHILHVPSIFRIRIMSIAQGLMLCCTHPFSNNSSTYFLIYLASLVLVLQVGLLGKEVSSIKSIWCSMPFRVEAPLEALEKHFRTHLRLKTILEHILVELQRYTQNSMVDKGLIPTKDDGPWHMLRRKRVPWSLPLFLFSLV